MVFTDGPEGGLKGGQAVTEYEKPQTHSTTTSRRTINKQRTMRLILISLIALCFPHSIDGYEGGDHVAVSMNKVWPHNNPSETYSYYKKLPVCVPPAVHGHSMSFGQIMRGDRLVNSLYNIGFNVTINRTIVCTRPMSPSDLAALRTAIHLDYMFELYVADVPVYQPIGLKVVDEKTGGVAYYLATYFDFQLGHNQGEVVSVNLYTDQYMTNITATPHANDSPVAIEFSYGVHWAASDVPVESKLKQQMSSIMMLSGGALDIHWLGIANSFVLVLLGVCLVSFVLLRIVRSDLAKYLRIPDEELAAGAEEESGWKLLHADVFRPPPHRLWFCALIGSGAHLFFVVVATVLIGCITPYLATGGVLTSGISGYLLTSFISGYISANLYRRLGGQKWAWNIIITSVMFMGPAFVVWSLLNTVAIFYSSTAALPFLTAVTLFFCWLFVTVPLTVMGGIVGRRRGETAVLQGKAFPYKTTRLAREIPSVRLINNPLLHVLLSGFLPFTAIYIELHYVFASMWGAKVYTMYGVLLLAVVMLNFVAATVTILLTYVHLSAEDHRWWWRSFIGGGSVALYFYLHCFYYFFVRSTRMFGVLQLTFFFGYSLLAAWGICLVMGFFTFFSSYSFVHYIYSNIKAD